MTWTPQTTNDTNWSQHLFTISEWDCNGLVESNYRQQSTLVVTHAGPGTFNVTGQTFNQTRILFNHTVARGGQDINFTNQTTNQTAWRTP